MKKGTFRGQFFNFFSPAVSVCSGGNVQNLFHFPSLFLPFSQIVCKLHYTACSIVFHKMTMSAVSKRLQDKLLLLETILGEVIKM